MVVNILIDKSKYAGGKLSGWGGTPRGDEAGTAGGESGERAGRVGGPADCPRY